MTWGSSPGQVRKPPALCCSLPSAFKTLECVAGVKGRAASQFLRSGKSGRGDHSGPACRGHHPVWPTGVAASSACVGVCALGGGSCCSITDACRGSRSQARMLRPRLPTGAEQMTDPDGAQAHGARLCKEGGRPLWMQMSSGLQCAVYPSRCLHGAFPEEVGSLSGEIGSCSPKAVIVEMHGGGWYCRQTRAPHPTAKAKTLSPVCSLPCGLSESTAGGGPLLPPSAFPPSSPLCLGVAWSIQHGFA